MGSVVFGSVMFVMGVACGINLTGNVIF